MLRLTCALIGLLASPALAVTTFWVSPDGSDANPGTVAAPWKTIQKAADTATPGSTVFVRGGTYRERVTVHVSGDATHGPITFRNAGTEHVVIDGSTLVAPAGTTALLRIDAQHDLAFDGFELAHYATNVTNTVVAGVFVSGTCSNISFTHLLVRDIRHDGKAANGTDAHAIAVYGTSGTTATTGITIADNEVRDCVLGSSEAVVCNGNVDGFRIERNLVHDCNNIGILAVGWEGTAPANDQARNGTIADNVVFDITSYGNPAYGTDRSAGGIYCDGCRDTVIERNVAHHVDLGIEVGNEHGGRTTTNVTVRDNLLYLNNVTGLAFGGYDATRGIVTGCRFTGNTLWANDTTRSGTGEICIQKAHDNTLRSNVLFTSDQAIAITNYFSAANSYANTFDYDLIRAPGGVDPLFTWQNADIVGLAAFRARTGQELHGTGADPLFVASGATPPDLRLLAGSPAIDAGDPAFVPASGETDAAGGTRVVGTRVDIGAHEWRGCPATSVAGSARMTLAGPWSGRARLEWSALDAATGYDAVRGDVATLRSGGFGSATQACAVRDTPRLSLESTELPTSGNGSWWLVRGRNCQGAGTYDDNAPGQVAPRDAGIASSPNACP